MTTYPIMKQQLLDHQKVGFTWMKLLSDNNLGGILADEPGLGKTFQSITYIKSELQEYPDSTVLIVVPAGLVWNWKAEFEKFSDIKVETVMYGGRRTRIKKGTVMITSYPTFLNDSKIYSGLGVTHLILDEGQYVKNKWTKTYKAVLEVSRSSKTFILTGTPIENSADDLVNLLRIANKSSVDIRVGTLPEVVSDLVLRRNKVDTIKLDPINRVLVESEMHESVKGIHNMLYDKYNRAKFSSRSLSNKLDGMRMNREEVPEYMTEQLSNLQFMIRSTEIKLKQWLNSPLLLKKAPENDSNGLHKKVIDDFDASKVTNLKYDDFKKMVNSKVKDGHKIIVFTQFTGMMDIIEDDLPESVIDYRRISGATPPQKRVEYVNEFNSNKDISVMIVSLRAGGTGLNITGADTVILYDHWWNPQVEEQAIGRAHRLGQTKEVTVYKTYTKESFEETIIKSQNRKIEVFDYYLSNN